MQWPEFLCPAGPVDDEIPSALSLAQKARGFATTAVANRWCRQAAEQEMRNNIAELRAKMMSEAGNDAANTYRLAELMQNLQVIIIQQLWMSFTRRLCLQVQNFTQFLWQIIKSQSWERQKEKSEKIKEQLQVFIQFHYIWLHVLNNRNDAFGWLCRDIWTTGASGVAATVNRARTRWAVCRNISGEKWRSTSEVGELAFVGQILGTFVKMWVFLKSTEGKAEADKIQERVGRIQELRKALRAVFKNTNVPQKLEPCTQVRHFNLNPALCR